MPVKISTTHVVAVEVCGAGTGDAVSEEPASVEFTALSKSQLFS